MCSRVWARARSSPPRVSIAPCVCWKGQPFDLAILDVNLGTENSVAVADGLAARKVPFVFATGYGDGSIFLKDHAAMPVIKKPYGAAEIVKALAELGLS